MIGCGAETVGTDAGQAHALSTPFPCHYNMHGNNKFGLASPLQPRPAAAHGRDDPGRAAEDRRRLGQPRAGAGPGSALT
ncbi:MAG: hypothetical protein WDM92_08140 [Caulobacteraceae bacterium]